jgi:polysaccharide pyruvyl transferase WcaK-like protein
MSYRVRVSARQLVLMLRALDEDVTLDVMLPPNLIAHVTQTMSPVVDADGMDLTTLLNSVLQEQEGDKVIHSLVI